LEKAGLDNWALGKTKVMFSWKMWTIVFGYVITNYFKMGIEVYKFMKVSFITVNHFCSLKRFK
jgi:hypothetical protein